MQESEFRSAVDKLRGLQTNLDENVRRMIAAKTKVFDRYQPIFQPSNLPSLSAADFQSFLLPKNNYHWSSIHRTGPRICSDMKRLRESLAFLLDESRPIEERVTGLHRGGDHAVPGLGKAIFTPILHVVYPEKYGVWNTISGTALARLNLLPATPRGASYGKQYADINSVLNRLAAEVPTDLWVLDGLLERVGGDGRAEAVTAGARSALIAE